MRNNRSLLFAQRHSLCIPFWFYVSDLNGHICMPLWPYNIQHNNLRAVVETCPEHRQHSLFPHNHQLFSNYTYCGFKYECRRCRPSTMTLRIHKIAVLMHAYIFTHHTHTHSLREAQVCFKFSGSPETVKVCR